MTPTETATLLRRYNERCRDCQFDDPHQVMEAIDAAVEMIERLEEAESDALEQARLNGMGSEREAALMAKLEAAEKSDAESLAMYRKARDERDAQLERERINAEVQAKASAALEAERIRLRAEAEARMQAMQADAAKRAAELKAMADAKPEPTPQFAQPQADTGAKVTLGQINQRLSPIALSVAGLAQLGIPPAGKERAAVLYLESDVARICSVLIRHLTTVARGEIKEAA